MWNGIKLSLTQNSKLGLMMVPVHCASIGQADDVALVSDDIHKLLCLLHLAMSYAEEYHVQMVPEKTKLLCFTPKGQELQSYYWEVANPITMAGKKVEFSTEAEHVGVIRTTAPGSLVNILARQFAHQRALFAVLSAGLARLVLKDYKDFTRQHQHLLSTS